MKDLSDAEHRRWQRRRREAYRQHHPDMGGTPEELETALAAVDREFGVAQGHIERDRVYVFSTHGPLAVIGGAVYAVIHYVQRRTTRRTYFDL